MLSFFKLKYQRRKLTTMASGTGVLGDDKLGVRATTAQRLMPDGRSMILLVVLLNAHAIPVDALKISQSSLVFCRHAPCPKPREEGILGTSNVSPTFSPLWRTSSRILDMTPKTRSRVKTGNLTVPLLKRP